MGDVNARPDPELSELLELVSGHASARKLRQFAVACSRRVLHLYRLEPSRQAVSVAELFVDTRADAGQLEQARQDAFAASWAEAEVGWYAHIIEGRRIAAASAALADPLESARRASEAAAEDVAHYDAWKAARRVAFAAVRRSAVAGNRQVVWWNPAWDEWDPACEHLGPILLEDQDWRRNNPLTWSYEAARSAGCADRWDRAWNEAWDRTFRAAYNAAFAGERNSQFEVFRCLFGSGHEAALPYGLSDLNKNKADGYGID